MIDERPEPETAEESVALGTTAEPFEAASNEPVPDGTRAAWPVPAAWFDVRHWIAAAWLLGAGGLGVWWLTGLVGLARLVRRARPVPGACRAALREIAGPAAERVSLLESDRIDQPFACLDLRLRPVIVLPATLCAGSRSDESRDDRALRWCLAHEWSHVQRRDLWSWLLAGLVRTLFFYQPLAWWLRRELRLCQDYIADARAAEQTAEPEDYAQFLTTQALAGSSIAAAGLGIGGGKSDLYRRVVMVVTNAGSLEGRCGRLWNVSAVAAMLTALVGVSGFRTPLAAVETSAVETTAVEADSSQKPTVAAAANGVAQRSAEVNSTAAETPNDTEQQQLQNNAHDAPSDVSRMRLTAVRASDDMPMPDLRIDVEFWRDGQHRESFVTNTSGVADLELPPGSQNLLWVRIRARPPGMVPISLAWGASRITGLCDFACFNA
jgi:beta-lactamase regulating signal transducer with metallopeptidase domain